MRNRLTFCRPAVAVLCLAAGLAGCASTPVPTEQLAVGRASVDAAQTAGAGDTASAELNLARDKLSRAQLALRSGDHVIARRLAEQADIDAQVARSKAGADKSRKAAAEVDASLRTLREELNRQQVVPAPTAR